MRLCTVADYSQKVSVLAGTVADNPSRLAEGLDYEPHLRGREAALGMIIAMTLKRLRKAGEVVNPLPQLLPCRLRGNARRVKHSQFCAPVFPYLEIHACKVNNKKAYVNKRNLYINVCNRN